MTLYRIFRKRPVRLSEETLEGLPGIAARQIRR